MKKFAAIAVAASMFALAACEKETPAPPPAPSEPTKPVKDVKPVPCNPQKQPGGRCPDIP